MSSSKRALLFILAGVAGLALLVGVAPSARAYTPAAAAPGATIVDRKVVKDGTGVPFPNGNADVGYKIWISTDATPDRVTDESGNAVVNGLLHQVCVSSGAAGEWAVAYDSGTAANTLTYANYASDAPWQLVPPVVRTTTQQNCQVYDVQFSNGLVTLQSAVTLGSVATYYWRPSRGGGN